MTSAPPEKKPTVSVIVPARQAAHTLPECLAAIAASDWSPLDVVVIVDGVCSDATAEVAAAHGARVISLPERLGPAGARNAGAASAEGDILVFVDADVAVRPDAIGRLVRGLNDQSRVDAVFGSYDLEPAQLGVASQYKNLLHHYVHQRGREEANTFWSGLGAIRRQTFEKLGGFDTKRYPRPSIEDIELGHRLREAGSEIRLVKSAQGSHLKRWTPLGVFRTDLFDRALPWTELILRSGRFPDDLNLAPRHRVGVIATAVLVVSLFAAGLNARFLAVAGVALLIALAAGADVFRFFVRERGWFFAILSVPLHLSYYAASGLGFGLGVFRHTAPIPARSLMETKRIFTNTSALAVGEIAARGLAFLATVHVARVLGAAGFGRVELALTLILYVATLSTFGLDLVGTLRVAIDPDHARALARTIVSLRLALSALATAALLLLTLVVPRFAEIRILLMLTAITVFMGALSLDWLFQGLERMKRVAAVGILGQGVYTLGVLLFVKTQAHILRVPLASAAGAAVASGTLGVVAWRALARLPRAGAPGLAKALLIEAAPLAAITAAGIVAYNADVIILAMIGDDRHVGIYRSAGRIAGVFSMLGGAFTTAMFPTLARESRDREKFRAALDWSLRMSAVGWILASSVLFAGAPLLLRWTFGASYSEATRTLRLLLLAAAVVGVRAQYRSALVALRQARRNLPPTLWAAATNVILNLILIPRLGLIGIALTAIVSELLLLVLVRREVALVFRRETA